MFNVGTPNNYTMNFSLNLSAVAEAIPVEQYFKILSCD